MSSVHPTKHGTFEVKFREGKRQRSKTFKTKKAASTFARNVETRMEEGKPVRLRRDVPSLDEFTVGWLASRGDLAPVTQALYASWLEKHVLPHLGHLPLIDLRPRRLAEWQRERLADGAGPAILGKTQNVLSQILDTAVLPYEFLDVNPMAALRAPAYAKKEHRWLTAEEVEQLRIWFLDAEDAGSATLISVLAYVGIRPQDALARLWSDLGPKLAVTTKDVDGSIKSGAKSGEGYKRQVIVPETVRIDLEAWRAESPEAGLIFPRASDGKPWNKCNWDNWRNRRFKKAAKEVGLGKDLKPYDLRHTGATLFAAAGWDHIELAHQLGHSPEVSMRIYQHLIEAAHGNPRRSVDEWIRQARGVAPVRDLFGAGVA